MATHYSKLWRVIFLCHILKKNDILYPAGQVLMGIQFSSESELNIREIKEYLKGKIPTYMIPNRIVQLRELPMTNNGKIDRKKLYLQKKQF